MPDTGSRQRRRDGRTSGPCCDVVRDGLLRFMFAEEGDERSQIADLVARVEAAARSATPRTIPDFPASVRLPNADGTPTVRATSFDDLCELIARAASRTTARAGAVPIAGGTVPAFLRRLDGARFHCGHLIRGRDAADIEAHRDRLARDPGLGDRHPQPARPREALRRRRRDQEAVRGQGALRAARARSSSSSSTSSTSTRRARAGARSRRCCSTSPSAVAASA